MISKAFSQGKINAPKIECLKNITSFSYTAPSGLVLVAVKWNFGDGSTSTQITPQYIYKSSGIFKISTEATFANNSTLIDSAFIEVKALPKAHFYIKSLNDTCLNNNQICCKDTSSPAKTGQNIVRRYFVWGDGYYNLSNNPQKGDEFCHSYSIANPYLLKMEVTDIFGCMNSTNTFINILNQTTADMAITNIFKDCNSKMVCIKNNSAGKNVSTATYEWIFDPNTKDTNRYFNALKCLTYNSSTNALVTLKVRDKNGCTDSVSVNYSIFIDSMPGALYLSDSTLCYGDQFADTAYVQKSMYDKLEWLLDNIPLNGSFTNKFLFNASSFSLLPGMHTIACRITRGKCIKSYIRNFKVMGPIAGIKIFDNNQCLSNRPLFFIDDSKYEDRMNTLFKMKVNDQYGNPCVSNKLKNINNFKNCNTTLDWYFKHKFNNKGKSYTFSFYLKDSVSGCQDSLTRMINFKDCCPLLDLDSFSVCQGEYFDLETKKKPPKFVSIDSGRTWRKFPMKIDNSMHGTYGVTFIFETVFTEWVETIGNDSFRIRTDTLLVYDTIFIPDYLKIRPLKNDSITFRFYGKCSPFRVSVVFNNGNFNNGDFMDIDWADGTSYKKQFKKSEKLDSVMHTYFVSAVDFKITAKCGNSYGCSNESQFTYESGKFIFSNIHNAYFCNNSPVCFTPKVFDVKLKTYWNNSDISKQIEWIFSDSNGSIKLLNPCKSFSTKGKVLYSMIVNDQNGCNDTLYDSLFIQDLHAGVKNTSKVVFCSEFKQFFDSSVFLPFPNESITYYNWDFGLGQFTNPYKDPFKSLNTSLEYIPVTHIVRTQKGCMDTVRFKLKVIGGNPYFRIRDTIACNSLNALFFNQSKNCKGFIWEFGDPDKNILQTNEKKDIGFVYDKPGRYSIKLYGLDTIYNPATNSTYYCNNIFPDPVFQKDSIRNVFVMPVYKTGISGPDTVCPGQFSMFSMSNPHYYTDKWEVRFDSAKLPAGTPFNYKLDKPGYFIFTLNPFYQNPAYNICRDSATKGVTVLGVEADFIVDPGSSAPIYKFINRSNPLSAMYQWDFGQEQGFPDNYSTLQNPQHNYGFDTGEYKICLIASLPYGCVDTICKNIFNDYLAGFMIFNVFTPGNADGKNDKYDILIEGEDSYDLTIFNRWGEIVFKGDKDADNSLDINWNGKYMNNGEDCPAGNYYYIFKYSLKNNPGKAEIINGTVTLIR